MNSTINALLNKFSFKVKRMLMVSFAFAILLGMAGFGYGIDSSEYEPWDWDDDGLLLSENWSFSEYIGITRLNNLTTYEEIYYRADFVRRIATAAPDNYGRFPYGYVHTYGRTTPLPNLELGLRRHHQISVWPGFSLYSWTNNVFYEGNHQQGEPLGMNVTGTTTSGSNASSHYFLYFNNLNVRRATARLIQANFVELNIDMLGREVYSVTADYNHLEYRRPFKLVNLQSEEFPNLYFEALYLTLSSNQFQFWFSGHGEHYINLGNSFRIERFKGDYFYTIIEGHRVRLDDSNIYIAPIAELPARATPYTTYVVAETVQGRGTANSATWEFRNQARYINGQLRYNFMGQPVPGYLFYFTVRTDNHVVTFKPGEGGTLPNANTNGNVVHTVQDNTALGSARVPVATRPNHTFLHWLDYDSGETYSPAELISEVITRNRTFIAVWEPDCCGTGTPCPGPDDCDCGDGEECCGLDNCPCGDCGCPPINGGCEDCDNCDCEDNGGTCDCTTGGGNGTCDCTTGGGNGTCNCTTGGGNGTCDCTTGGGNGTCNCTTGGGNGTCNCTTGGGNGTCDCTTNGGGNGTCDCTTGGNQCTCQQGPCACLTGGQDCGCEGDGDECNCCDTVCDCGDTNNHGWGTGNNPPGTTNNEGPSGTWSHPGTPSQSPPPTTTTNNWNPNNNRPVPLPVPRPPADPQGRRTHRWFIQGYPEGDVRADGFMTRAEMAAMFFNLSESPDRLTTSYNAGFRDIHTGQWHFRAINYAAVRHNSLSGFPDGSFRPNQHITFAEFAAFATGFFNLRELAPRAVFADQFDHWAADFLAYSFDPTWFDMWGNNFVLVPDAPIPRSIAVTLVNHYTGRVPNPEEIRGFLQGRHIYSDIRSNNHWAFYEIMTASIAHTFTVDEDGNQIWDRRDSWWLVENRQLLGNWWFLRR